MLEARPDDLSFAHGPHMGGASSRESFLLIHSTYVYHPNIHSALVN